MKNYKSRHSLAKAEGFTLIEVLVVVMIIAILGIIAVPQYIRIVERSRMSEAQVALKAAAESIQRAEKIKHGIVGENNWDMIDIKMGGDYDKTTHTYTTSDFVYTLNEQSLSSVKHTFINATKREAPYYSMEMHVNKGDLSPVICTYATGDTKAKSACEDGGYTQSYPNPGNNNNGLTRP
ncbi:prepilin-type N-terminal cleavage/methylation domain-containing protein [Elusimicrobium simillimum]|uniref:type IV pilin protein n=1 Tax=Elusimicrobium simillimum TaxID=3143438 RepID=UPI003C6FD693